VKEIDQPKPRRFYFDYVGDASKRVESLLGTASQCTKPKFGRKDGCDGQATNFCWFSTGHIFDIKNDVNAMITDGLMAQQLFLRKNNLDDANEPYMVQRRFPNTLQSGGAREATLYRLISDIVIAPAALMESKQRGSSAEFGLKNCSICFETLANVVFLPCGYGKKKKTKQKESRRRSERRLRVAQLTFFSFFFFLDMFAHVSLAPLL
jgi:hypothetical protein